MSATTLIAPFVSDGVPYDPASVCLRDPPTTEHPLGTYGVKRTDTDAVVVAAGTPLIKLSTGIWAITFTDPAPGLTYNYWVEFVVAGATVRWERNQSAPAIAAGATGYLAVAAADAIAALRPGLASYKAATADAKGAALLQASDDIDLAMRYQGRKYDATQEHQFPRINGDPPAYPLIGSPYPFSDASCSEVWDYDPTSNIAIVPPYVNLAVVYQADSILAGDREARLKDQHDGVVNQSADGLSEQYSGRASGLCRRAYDIMKEYQLRSGSLI